MYENIRKITRGQGDDCTTDGLLDSNFFKENFKLVAIELSKYQAVDANPKAMK